MRIQHNISALNTHRNLGFNQTQTSKALEKLSSGYKINRAGDDAAGLAISEKMRGQIRGINMASKNAQDGISLIQTAEGALNEVHALLQRGRELAVQAANDTNVESDRQALQLEVEQIKEEVNRIGKDTEFNTLKILQGSGSQGLSAEELGKLTEQVKLFLEGSEQAVKATYGIGPDAAVKDMTMKFVAKDTGNTLAWVTSYVNQTTGIAAQWDMTFDTMDYNGDPSQQTDIALTTLHEMTHAMMSASGVNWKDTHNPKWFKEGTAEYMTGGMGRLINDLKIQGGAVNFDSASNISIMLNRIDGASDNSEFYSASYATTRYLDDWLKGKGSDLSKVLINMQATKGTLDNAIQATTTAGSGATLTSFEADLKGTPGITAIQGYIAAGGVGSAIAGATTDATVVAAIKGQAINEADHFKYIWGDSQTFGTISLQIGANENQTLKFRLPNISAGSVGIQDANLTTQQKASESISLFDSGIRYVSQERSTLGALQNRLEHTINNLGNTAENLTAAESRIRDTDMAKDMMYFTKKNILMQAAQSMLSQANQQPQGVLQLLG